MDSDSEPEINTQNDDTDVENDIKTYKRNVRNSNMIYKKINNRIKPILYNYYDNLVSNYETSNILNTDNRSFKENVFMDMMLYHIMYSK